MRYQGEHEGQGVLPVGDRDGVAGLRELVIRIFDGIGCRNIRIQYRCGVYRNAVLHEDASGHQQIINRKEIRDAIHPPAFQEDLGRRAAGHRQLLETAALQRQRAAVGVNRAERTLTAGLFLGIRDGQALAAAQPDRSAVFIERKPIQVDDKRRIRTAAEIDLASVSGVGIQLQRAAVCQPILDRPTDIIIGRIAHPCQDAGLTAVQAFAILRVGVRTFYDLDFLDRIVTFQFACIFQKRSVLPERIALCQ